MKKLLLILSLMLLYVQGTVAQLISLGTETGAGSTNVLLSTSTTNNKFSRTISIYTAAEMLAAGGNAGTITSLWWKKNGTGEYPFADATLNVYIKNTANSLWAAVPSWDTEVNGATQVFASTTYSIPTGTGFKQVVFSNNFIWDGISNIEILVDWYRPSTPTADITWSRSTNTTTNASRVGATLVSITPFLLNSNRPLVQLQLGPPLPLTLVSFAAQIKNGSSYLNWNTQSEYNTAHFEVQVSKDGLAFTECGKVSAAGNSSSARTYSYSHTPAFSPLQSYAYYRLKMVDIDGKFTYSTIVKVALRQSDFNVSVYPNPIKDVFSLSVMQAGNSPLSYKIITLDGRSVSQKSNIVSGSAVLTIDVLANQPAGTYLLQVWAGNKYEQIKLNKL